MRYAIQQTFYYTDHVTDGEDMKMKLWAIGIHMPKFKDRPKIPRADWTPYLTCAGLWDDVFTASHMAKLVSTPEAPARVVEISNKDLFTAKLKGV
jgi:hypothetical protein